MTLESPGVKRRGRPKKSEAEIRSEMQPVCDLWNRICVPHGWPPADPGVAQTGASIGLLTRAAKDLPGSEELFRLAASNPWRRDTQQPSILQVLAPKVREQILAEKGRGQTKADGVQSRTEICGVDCSAAGWDQRTLHNIRNRAMTYGNNRAMAQEYIRGQLREAGHG